MTDRFDWQPDKARMLTEMRMEFGLSVVTRKVVESDPADWPTPHSPTVRASIRNTLRRCARIIGYEYRKAAGCQRRHTDPKSLGIIKGITS